ncbi:MAG: glycosyltransferase family 4 protein [Desulfobacterales bacterium]
MPYRSSLFRDLKGKRLNAYLAAFSQTLKAAVSDFNPDIIHSNHLFLLSALIRKLFPDIPVVATCHGTDLRQYQNCPHLRCFVIHFCRKLDKIIALTADQQQEISRLYNIPTATIAVVGGGYDESIFVRATKPSPEPVQLLYAGKFNRSKGVPWLLKSLMRIKQFDWHLHMAGGGKGREFDTCLELAEKLGPRVTNHGYVNHRRLAKLMQQAHIQVLPSFFEGLPLVLFEGLASGCRIITTHLPGFHEIFGNAKPDTVRLIQLPPLETIDRPYQKDEAGLEHALCNSILDMMAAVRQSPELDDPEAGKISARYTWPRVFERTLRVYRQAIHLQV